MYHSLGSPSSSVNWAGFYVLDRRDRAQLILGPFHGKVACQTIEIGQGVCGTAAKQGKTLLLEDVKEFPDHIVCDGDSKSEIVVPIKVGEEVSPPNARKVTLKHGLTMASWQVVGVIDIDCADLQGFDGVDQEGLEQLAKILSDYCDWDDLLSPPPSIAPY